jgi:hypothetical protein
MSLAKWRLRDYGILAAFVAVAYWPLSTLHHMTLWDSIEAYFPARYFLSDCLRQGILPLWNPYQMGGSPFCGDPQSGAWYPMAWIFCSIAPYNFALFQIEYVVTFLIAAIGMYELVDSFRLSRPAALIAAISYCCCGFFVSNAEHLTWVVSAAWIPWVFWAYHRMQQTRSIGYALLGALFLFLLLTGGYPAFLIVTSYLLFLFFLISILNRRTMAWVWKSLGLHLIFALAFLVLSTGVLLAWYQAMALTTRGSGVSLAQANIYAFTPRCLVSFLLPLASLKDGGFYDTDTAMRNAYIGLSCLLALPFAFIAARNRKLLVLLGVLSLLFLMAAFGAHTPIREWMYHNVPLMNVFRFPSMFRIFVIIGVIVLAAHGVDKLCANPAAYRRSFPATVCVLAMVFVLILVSSISSHGWTWHWGFLGADFESYEHQSSRIENIQLQSIVQIILLSSLLLAIYLGRARYAIGNILILFCAVDMAAATSMNAFSTVVSPERAPNIERPILHAPHGFPVPDNSVPLADWRDENRQLQGLRTNTGIYFKVPLPGGYNSFVLNGHYLIQRSAILDSLEANPYLYFADSLRVAASTIPLQNRAEVRVDSLIYFRYPNLTAPHTGNIHVQIFRPNQISAFVAVTDTSLISLQQNRAPGWRLFIDSVEAPIITTNYAQMGTIITPGRHRLDWLFDLPMIRCMMIITAASFFMLIACLGLFRRRLFPGLLQTK